MCNAILLGIEGKISLQIQQVHISSNINKLKPIHQLQTKATAKFYESAHFKAQVIIIDKSSKWSNKAQKAYPSLQNRNQNPSAESKQACPYHLGPIQKSARSPPHTSPNQNFSEQKMPNQQINPNQQMSIDRFRMPSSNTDHLNPSNSLETMTFQNNTSALTPSPIGNLRTKSSLYLRGERMLNDQDFYSFPNTRIQAARQIAFADRLQKRRVPDFGYVPKSKLNELEGKMFVTMPQRVSRLLQRPKKTMGQKLPAMNQRIQRVLGEPLNLPQRSTESAREIKQIRPKVYFQYRVKRRKKSKLFISANGVRVNLQQQGI